MALNPKRQRFVVEFLVDLNATAAAERAGYSAKNAAHIGSKLLRTPEISAAVAAAQAERNKRIERTGDDVLRALWRIADADLAEAFDAKGALKPIGEIPKDLRLALAGVESDDIFEGHGEDREHIGYARKLKLNDRTKALELLGKHHKLYTDKVEHSVDGELAELLKEARARAQRK